MAQNAIRQPNVSLTDLIADTRPYLGLTFFALEARRFGDVDAMMRLDAPARISIARPA
jgi:hypothetical protein